MADTPDQEPRIWHPITTPILVNGNKYYIRLFDSPYLPILCGYDEANDSFIKVSSLYVYPFHTVSQFSDFYFFP